MPRWPDSPLTRGAGGVKQRLAMPCRLKRNPHVFTDALDGERRRAADIGRHGFAAVELDFPAVQGAGDGAVADDALRQRAALVRAFVVHREDFVVG